MSGKIVKAIDRKFYKLYHENWDDALFRQKILKYANADTVLLDVGAGAGIVNEMNFRGIVKEVYGVDPDDRVLGNKNLDKAYVGFGDNMPFFHEGQFDLVISDNVLEHIMEGEGFFCEINRVLKKGGLFITKTPNKYHYVPLFARITSKSFHDFYNALRGRSQDDTFPTYYRLNTKKEQVETARKSGFDIEEVAYHEGRPEYLRVSSLSYLCGLAYERIVNRLGLDDLKVIMISTFKKL